MINQETLKEKIRTIYFGLISETSFYSYEELLTQAVKELNQILKATYIGLYSYDHMQKKYIKMENALKAPKNLMNIDQLNKVSFDIGETCFSLTTSECKKTFMINLTSNYEPESCLFVLVHEKNIDRTELLLIKSETERFLNLMNYYQENIINDRRNELLYSLSTLLHSSTDKNVVLTDIVESLGKIYPSFSHNLLLSHDFEIDESFPIKSIEYSDADERKSSNQAFITGEVQIEAKPNADDTRLYAPLLGNQGVYGVIQIIVPTTICYSESELMFIAQIAKTAGKALESAILYESSIEQASDLKFINKVTHRLNSNLNLSELVQTLKSEIASICKPSEIGIVYFNEQSEQGYTIFSESTSFFEKEAGQLFAEFIYKKMSTKSEAVFSGDYSINYPHFKYHSIMSIPMIESGQLYGFIIVLHESKTYFTFENFKLVQSLTYHATLSLVNAVLREKLEKAVITDYLTGLYSRNYLDKMFSEHIRTDKQGTFILFDIDDFKQINDRYGHAIGDEVIVMVADIIKNCITSEEIAARWGGEEFAVYLPHVGLIKGVHVAEKIRKQVAEKTDPSVTFSCGVSTWSKEYTDSVDDVFIRADRALYEAKGIGKNRVIIDDQLSGYINQ